MFDEWVSIDDEVCLPLDQELSVHAETGIAISEDTDGSAKHECPKGPVDHRVDPRPEKLASADDVKMEFGNWALDSAGDDSNSDDYGSDSDDDDSGSDDYYSDSDESHSDSDDYYSDSDESHSDSDDYDSDFDESDSDSD